MNRLLFFLLFFILAFALGVGCRSAPEQEFFPSDQEGWVVLDDETQETPTRIPVTQLVVIETPRKGETLSIPPTVTVADLPLPATHPTNSEGGNSGNNNKQTEETNPTNSAGCKKEPCDTPQPPLENSPQATAAPTPTVVISEETASRFPQTPIIPFDREVLITHLELVRDSFRSFTLDWVPILGDERERNRGDCGAFRGWYLLWVEQSPAFTGVPAQWLNLYYEYRLLLQQAVNHTDQIQKQCFNITLPAGAAQDDNPTTFFTTAYPRLEEMVHQSYQLP